MIGNTAAPPVDTSRLVVEHNGSPPIAHGVGREQLRPGRRKLFTRLYFAAIFVIAVLAVIPNVLRNWLWLRQLGFADIFWTVFSVEWGMACIAFIGAFLFLWINIRQAARNSFALAENDPKSKIGSLDDTRGVKMQSLRIARHLLTRATMLTAAIVAAAFALGIYTQWDTYLRFRYGESVGLVDPIFKVDVGFYLFRLPFYELLRGSCVFLTALAIIAVVSVNACFGLLRFRDDRNIETWGNAVRHLTVLFFILTATFGFGFYLDRYELLYSTRGVVHGVGYTAAHATLVALWVMIGVSAVACALLIFNFFRPTRKAMAIGVCSYAATYMVAVVLAPALVQQFVVEPNELAFEKPYLENYIEFTRKAYNLDVIQETAYPALEDLTPEMIARNQGTIQNIRLWDSRPLLQTYQQTQAIRLYYEFYNVDTDRYHLADGYHQVMLSTRELAENLPAEARTWVNYNLQFTHGEGVVMNFVSKITPGGFPVYLVDNIPPESTRGVKTSQPAIYYGESMRGSRIVATGIKEFDYPKGNQNVYESYQGNGGIPIDSFGKRLLFAWTQGDINLLLTSYLEPGSRIQIWRDVRERVSRVAPFLSLDSDPYAVVSEGKQYWIQDVYTTSNRFPYSNPHQTDFGAGLNYIRNSAKAVVDMYDGTVSFYVMDPADPVLAVYRRAFPGVFKDLNELPPDLKLHLRYPQDLFGIQADQYESFHMTDPQVFYNREDLWVAPEEKYDGAVGAHGTVLHPHEASGKRAVGIPHHESFHAAKQGQYDRLDGRQVRFPRVRKNAVLRASQGEVDLRPESSVRDDRPEHHDFATIDPLGSKRLGCHSRQIGRDPDREFLPLCGPALSQGRGHELSPAQTRHRGDRKQGRDGTHARRGTERAVWFLGKRDRRGATSDGQCGIESSQAQAWRNAESDRRAEGAAERARERQASRHGSA